MAVTETTTESWGSRLGSSIKGVLIGLALFIAGFPVLFWNEGDSVKTAKAIDEGEGACIAVESNANVDQEMEGKLVHMSGKADTKDVLTDDTFGVSATASAMSAAANGYKANLRIVKRSGAVNVSYRIGRTTYRGAGVAYVVGGAIGAAGGGTGGKTAFSFVIR